MNGRSRPASRRTSLRLAAVGAVALAACGQTQIIERVVEVPVERPASPAPAPPTPAAPAATPTPEVRVVEKTVEKIVEKIVEKPVEVIRVVTRLVVVTVTPDPTPTPAITAVRFATTDVSGARRLTTTQALDDFQRAHPNVLVKSEPIGPGFLERLRVEVEARAAAHLVAGERDDLFPAAAAGVVVEVTDAIEKAVADRDTLTAAPGTVSLDGEGWFGLPYRAIQGVWLANLTLFESAGVAPPADGYGREDAEELAAQIDRVNSIDWGINVPNDPFWGWGPLALASLARSSFWDARGLTAFAAPGSIGGPAWGSRLGIELDIAPTPGGLERIGQRPIDAPTMFRNGRVGFGPLTTDAIATLAEQAVARFSVDVIPGPTTGFLKQAPVPLATSSHLVTRTALDENRVEAAVTLAAYLAGPEVQSLAAARKAWVPVHPEARADGTYTAPVGTNLAGLSRVLDEHEFATPVGFSAGWSAFETTLRRELASAYEGALALDDEWPRAVEAAIAAKDAAAAELGSST